MATALTCDVTVSGVVNVAARFTAYGWHVSHVADVNDLAALDAAIAAAKAETSRPSLIVTRTHIGFGSPNRVDTAKAHGEPLGKDEVAALRQRIGIVLQDFRLLDHMTTYENVALPFRVTGREARRCLSDAAEHEGGRYRFLITLTGVSRFTVVEEVDGAHDVGRRCTGVEQHGV